MFKKEQFSDFENHLVKLLSYAESLGEVVLYGNIFKFNVSIQFVTFQASFNINITWELFPPVFSGLGQFK